MFKTALSSIAAHVQGNNPFFAQGFPHAWMDEETGYIWADTADARKPIFPDDRLGDYFYLRVVNGGKLQEDHQRFPLMGCTRTGIMATATARVVAIVGNAHPDLLTQRLINVLAQTPDSDIRLTAFNWNREEVLVTEMASAAEDEVEAALQRITPGLAIVSIDFQLSVAVPYKKLNCLPDICISCKS